MRPGSRYQVALPFADEGKEALGDSLKHARDRFRKLDRGFLADPSFYDRYAAVIDEYFELGHAQVVPDHEVPCPPHSAYYLPHRAVLKEDSSSTKIRVVFDGSAKTTSGKSLNDVLLDAPNPVNDLINVMIRWRFFAIPLVADVRKMYRMVSMVRADRDFHRFLWQFRGFDNLTHCRLTRVAFGLKPSSYLSGAYIQHNAERFKEEFPDVLQAVVENFIRIIILVVQTRLNEPWK